MTFDLDFAGIQNIQDGWYIKNTIIPQAFSDGHWNIVVALTHLAAELILKGLIRLASVNTDKTHDIDDLLDQFQKLLVTSLDAIPRLMGSWKKEGSSYGLLLSIVNNDNQVNETVFKRVHRTVTFLNSYYVDATTVRNAHYTMSKNGDVVEFYRDNTLVTSLTDWGIAENLELNFKGISLLPIDENIINNLSTHVKALTLLKDKKALFSEVELKENDARNHMTHLNNLVNALKPFIVLVDMDSYPI